MSESATGGIPALQMAGISKSFGSTQVLHEVDLSVQRGSIHALIGHNGAGKSTLMKILNGVHRADRGTIRIDGRHVSFDSPAAARRAGIGMVYQEFSLIPELTVAQNIFLSTARPGPLGYLDDRSMRRRAVGILETLGVQIDPRTPITQLGIADQQLTEIAKALSEERSILVLDEPTAALSRHEIEALATTLRRLAASGLGIVFITHHLKEVLNICSAVTVLRDGRVVLDGSVAGQTLDSLVAAMIGTRSIGGRRQHQDISVREQEPLLDVQHLRVGDIVHDVSFSLYPGEVLGIAGLLGSGRTEILDALYGIRQPDGGSIILDGRLVRVRHPGTAIHRGIALVPEDRRTQGLVPNQSVATNISMSILDRLQHGLLFDTRGALMLAEKFVDDLEIAGAAPQTNVSNLSGGNQQKVVLAKSLATNAKILLLDDPTFGIDIRTARDIIRIVREFGAAGNAAIWISSDFDEIIQAADRILVLREGRIDREYGAGAVAHLAEEDLYRAAQ